MRKAWQYVGSAVMARFDYRLFLYGFLSLSLVAVVAGGMFLLHALAAAPIADDWSFYNTYQATNIIQFMEVCMDHTGRIMQWLVIYVGFALFDMNAIKIVPTIMYGIFVVLLAILLWNMIAEKKKYSAAWSLVIGALVAGATVWCAPSVFDAFLWYDSSASYMGSLLSLAANLVIMHRMASGRLGWATGVFFVAVMILGQLFSEPTSLMSIGISVVCLMASVALKKRRAVRVFLLTTASLVSGFVVLYFSPGSIERRAAAPEWNLFSILQKSFDGYNILLGNGEFWWLMIPALVIAVAFYTRYNVLRIRPKTAFILALGTFIASTYPVFVLSHMSQGYIPYRVFTLPTFGTVVAIVLLSICAASVMSARRLRRAAPAIMMATLFVILLTMPIFVHRTYGSLAKMVLRQQLVVTRDEQVRMQIRDKEDVIEIVRAPLLLRGNAEDFYYVSEAYGTNGRIWVLNTYLRYMGLDPEAPSDKVRIGEPPATYW